MHSSISLFLFCLYRYEFGLSCKLPLESFGIVTNSRTVAELEIEDRTSMDCFDV